MRFLQLTPPQKAFKTASTPLATTPRRRFLVMEKHWLLTYPRTASNLLIRILNLDEQEKVYRGPANEYFFLPTLSWKHGKAKLSSRPMSDWSREERQCLSKAFEESYDHLEKYLQEAETAGKNIFVKEHVPWLSDLVSETVFSFPKARVDEQSWLVSRSGPSRSKGNETVLADAFLKTWRPTFLIRHPALVFPSLYRTGLDAENHDRDPLAVEYTLHWSRSLHDWYLKHGDSSSQWPIILDADDIMTNPNLVKKYAKLIGLDESKLRFEWEAASTEQLENMNTVERRMLNTLNTSYKIVPGKTAAYLNISDEAQKWKAEFGVRVAARLLEFVCLAMPDYEYLRSKRLRPS